MRIAVRLIDSPPRIDAGRAQLHQLPGVVREVPSTTTIDSLISDAVRHLWVAGAVRDTGVGIEKLIEQIGSIDLVRPGLDLAALYDGRGQDIVGIGPDGAVLAPDETFSNLTIDDLRRARREGLLEGDPAQLVLAGSGSRHASLADSWEYLLAALATAKFAADAAQAAGDARGLGRMIGRRRARRWARHFVERGLLPRHLVRLIRRRKYWDTVGLARYLGVSAEEAAVLLEAAGYQFAPGTKEWVRQLADDEESTLEEAVRRGAESAVTGTIPRPRPATRDVVPGSGGRGGR